MIPNIDNSPASNSTECNSSPLMSRLQQTENNDINDLFDRTIDSYTVTQYQAKYLEVATRYQGFYWYQQRMGRFTALKAHGVLVRKVTTTPANLVKRIAGYATHYL